MMTWERPLRSSLSTMLAWREPEEAVWEVSILTLGRWW